MSILKKIINIFKTKEKSFGKDTILNNYVEINNAKLDNYKVSNEIKDKEVESITKVKTEKIQKEENNKNEISNIQIITSLKLINDDIKKDKIEDIEVLNILNEVSNYINVKEIKDIEIVKLNNKLDDKLKESIENIKNINGFENNILNIKKTLKLISTFNSEIITENVTYENFKLSSHYNLLNKIIEIVKEINKNKFRTLLENNLGSIYIDFENKEEILFREYISLNKKVDEFSKCIEIFKEEVEGFTKVINKANTKTKIEIKADLDKIKRVKKALEDKKQEYTKKEEKINNDIIKLCQKIEELIVMFNDILEYITVYIAEEKDNITDKLNTYTKEKNIKDIVKLKYTNELLKKLKNILQLRKEGL